MTTVILCLLSLATGLLIGWRSAWWWIERKWQRNPYAFRLLVDGVIELRIQEGRLQPLEEEKGQVD